MYSIKGYIRALVQDKGSFKLKKAIFKQIITRFKYPFFSLFFHFFSIYANNMKSFQVFIKKEI